MRRPRGWWAGAVALACGVLIAAMLGRAAGEPSEGLPPAAATGGAPAPGADRSPTPRDAGGRPLQAFSPESWWNTPVPADAPHHPDAAGILDHLRTGRQSGGGCVTLAGAENSWGQPVYWAQDGDPAYDVDVPRVDEPPELSSLRIPAGAEAAGTSDAAMTVFDVQRGYVVALTGAAHDDDRDTWRATGATVTYLASNGLDARARGSDEPRNLGSHRGNNGATMMVRHDQMAAGRIGNVVKVASGPELSRRFAWPMVGSDGDSGNPAAPAQGLRLRIKPSVDLDALDLHPQARVIAEGLQSYGMYLGDSAGTTALKLESTRAGNGADRWALPADALCGLPLGPRLWDVLPEGYDPSR